eukprot:TRINITY_DN2623_c0_g1_i3.p1 TRINITY_DN2623_c0_g1~~TRINITY_DN2623_c0_g1_i3.p1  ORF type:complete len:555 (-),score=137.01 TRINITY_DN2623_c0_g1_i3:88-1752(-)
MEDAFEDVDNSITLYKDDHEDGYDQEFESNSNSDTEGSIRKQRDDPNAKRASSRLRSDPESSDEKEEDSDEDMIEEDSEEDEDAQDVDNQSNDQDSIEMSSSDESADGATLHRSRSKRSPPKAKGACDVPGCRLCSQGPPPMFDEGNPTWVAVCRTAVACLTEAYPDIGSDDKKFFYVGEVFEFVDNHWDFFNFDSRPEDLRTKVGVGLAAASHLFAHHSSKKGHYALKEEYDPYGKDEWTLSQRKQRKRRSMSDKKGTLKKRKRVKAPEEKPVSVRRSRPSSSQFSSPPATPKTMTPRASPIASDAVFKPYSRTHSPPPPMLNISPSNSDTKKLRRKTSPEELHLLEDYYERVFKKSGFRTEDGYTKIFARKLGWEMKRIKCWLDNRKSKDGTYVPPPSELLAAIPPMDDYQPDYYLEELASETEHRLEEALKQLSKLQEERHVLLQESFDFRKRSEELERERNILRDELNRKSQERLTLVHDNLRFKQKIDDLEREKNHLQEELGEKMSDIPDQNILDYLSFDAVSPIPPNGNHFPHPFPFVKRTSQEGIVS